MISGHRLSQRLKLATAPTLPFTGAFVNQVSGTYGQVAVPPIRGAEEALDHYVIRTQEWIATTLQDFPNNSRLRQILRD